jgi:hypothetical protein
MIEAKIRNYILQCRHGIPLRKALQWKSRNSARESQLYQQNSTNCVAQKTRQKPLQQGQPGHFAHQAHASRPYNNP